MMKPNYSDTKILRKLLNEARPFHTHLFLILLLGLLATPLTLLTPIPLKIAVDNIYGSNQLPELFSSVIPHWFINSKLGMLGFTAIIQVLIISFVQLQSLGNQLLKTSVGEKLTLNFRARLFRHVQRLSLNYHDSKGTADSIYRIQYDAPSIQWVIIYGFIPFISSIVMFVAMICVIIRIDAQLALVALTISPFLFIFSRTYTSRMRGRYKDAKILESTALKVVQEVLTSVRLVKAFGKEEYEQERFLDHSKRGMVTRIWLSFAEGGFGLLVNITTGVGSALVLFIGFKNVFSGTLTLGELLMVLAYLAQLYEPLKTISNKTATIQSSIASAQRSFELLDELPEVLERPNARTVKRALGSISFENVSFSYNRSNTVLSDVSFNIKPGTRVGFIGRTGAGKTTIISLLTRFYDPNLGFIKLDGIDMRDYKISDLRNQFAIVLQESVLFSTTIAENISYGKPEAKFQEIVNAAKAANADEFINKLPDQYETLVGERGMKLSGGERQRIALARAFLKDAPILILDEPTSSVDIKTEASIIDAINRLMKGRTTFMISHRPATLEYCDFFIVIDEGRILTTSSELHLALKELHRFTERELARINVSSI
ncbi:MAG TPA: ABC transporter ATP-binding protein [Thermodesulfobacteriota bacterium]